MSDWFPAAIEIGGPIPRSVVNDLIEAIRAEDGALEDHGGPRNSREAIKDALKEGHTLTLCDERARYGQFEALEAFLVKHGIHFDRHSDSYCEFNAENVAYRGNSEPKAMLATQGGDNMVDCLSVLEVLENHALASEAKLQAIRDLVAPPQFAPLGSIRFTGGSA